MIIKLQASKLFTQDPAERFAKEFNVKESVWNELWKRHMVLEYTPQELCEYLLIKTGKKTNPRTMSRWVMRSEVYFKANPVVKMGAETVMSEFFGELEGFVIGEVVRQMRFSGAKSSRILL